MQKYLRFLILALVWVLGISFTAFAGIEPYENFLNGTLKKGDTLIVKDEKFRNPSFNWSDISTSSVKNRVELLLLKNQYLEQDFSCSMRLRIEYFNSPSQVTPIVIDSVKLDINYTKELGVSYKQSDSYFFQEGYHVKLIISDINSPEYGGNLPPVLQLSSYVVVNRKYRFESGVPLTINGIVNQGNTSGTYAMRGFNPGSNTTTNDRYLELYWSDQFPGADEYDVEWTVIDHLGDFSSLPQQMINGLAGLDPDPVFRNNATRITTSKELYRISLIYNSAYILTRIRRIDYNNGIREEGSWNYLLDEQTNKYAIWPLNWHETNLNWQYEVSFAEEGKRKEVINYFDGSLRNRQTGTLSNHVSDDNEEENFAIVQETVYDEFGRSVANILPAPVKETTDEPEYLRYFRNFNRNAIGQAYSFKDITVGCELIPGALSTTKGASAYYSPANQFISENTRNRYIPDAEGYPFSLTQYTADNTGRIKIQGGVGLKFQPGNGDNRTTKYYYGKPEQWELDHLFGNDVGYAEHYSKNMVIDPNGQISISYLNAGGKTIATAMSGVVPGNVDAIHSSGLNNNTRKVLLKPEQFNFDTSTLKLKATTTYLASIPDTAVSLHYNIQKLAYYRFNTNDFKPCSNCHYELNITVKDDCNNPIEITPSSRAIKIGSEEQNEGDLGIHTDSVKVRFDHIGEYYITFELEMKRNVIERFTDSLIVQGLRAGEIKDELSYVLKRLEDIDFKTCLSDCRTALELLGQKEDFRTMIDGRLQALGLNSAIGRADFEAWIDSKYPGLLTYAEDKHDNCPLQPETPCARYESAMLRDLTPGGQYALFNQADNEAIDLPANILKSNWRIGTDGGIFPVRAKDHQDYISRQFLMADGSYFSPHDADFKFKDLVKYWNPEWAQLFLSYHPEYCKLQFCESNSEYLEWDEQVKNQVNSVDDLHQVKPGLVYSNTISTWLMAADDFFATTGEGADYADDMALDLQQYSRRILESTLSTKNISQYIDYELYCSPGSTSTANAISRWNNACTTTCRVEDREWQTYKDIYFSLKQVYYDKLRDLSCTDDNCEIGTGIGVAVLPGTGLKAERYYLHGDQPSPIACDGQIIKITKDGNPTTAIPVIVKVPGEYSEEVVKTIYVTQTAYICIPEEMPFESLSVKAACSYHELLTAHTWNYGQQRNFGILSPTRTFDKFNQSYSGSVSGTWFLDPETCLLTIDNQHYNIEHISATSMILAPMGSGSSGDKVYYIKSTSVPTIYADYMFDEITNPNIVNFVMDNYPINYTHYKVYPYGSTAIHNYHLEVYGTGSDYGSQPMNFRVVSRNNVYNYTNVVVKTYQRNYSLFLQNEPDYHMIPNSHYDVNPSTNAKSTRFLIKPNDYNKSCEGIFTAEVYLPTGQVAIRDLSDDLRTAVFPVPQIRYDWSNTTFTNNNKFSAVVSSNSTGSCTTPPLPAVPKQCEIYKYKIAHFPKYKNSTSGIVNVTAAEAQNQLALTNEIKSACESRADEWLEKLAGGLAGKSPAEIASLKARLLAVCEKGGDIMHPMGASTLPSGPTSYGDTSFGQIIKSLNGGVYSKKFNPWLIDDVYPHGPLPQQATKMVLKTTEAICNKLITLRTERDLTDPTKSLHQFLYEKFGRAMDITEDELEALEQACGSCNHLLNQSVSLPVFLDPDANNKGCMTRAEYNTAKNALLVNELNNTLSIADGLLYEDILSTYINHTFGFTMPYSEYLQFENQPNPGANDLLCNLPAFKDIFMDPYACFKETMIDAVSEGQLAYAKAIQAERALFRKEYVENCSVTQNNVDLSTSQHIYHYTLYYYDQAGNLIRTVPPEGVQVLTKGQAEQVAASRNNKTPDCAYIGPTSDAYLPAVKNDLRTLLDGAAGATELWMYDANAVGGQTLIQVNKNYMLNYCISGGKLSAEIYTLNPNSANNELVITASKHYSGNVSSVMQWNHIVLQAANMQQQTGMQLWFNGSQVNIDDSPAVCGWDITGNPPAFIESIGNLKHLRTYNRMLSPTEIKESAVNGCLMPKAQLYLAWHRFNVPDEGDPTTIAANSTQENPFKEFYPQHQLISSYAYNSTNQVVKQQTPDAGISEFWYDRVSRLVASKNAEQRKSNKYSYTNYDGLGRITEVGQKNYSHNNYFKSDDYFVDDAALANFKEPAVQGTRRQITQTIYDRKPVGADGSGLQANLEQENLRSRVSASIYRETPDVTDINASYYSYDLAGNVKTLHQQIAGFGSTAASSTRRIDYEYDLVSGKVNFVSYQHGASDQFYYNYKYDAENRLTEAWSSVSATKNSYGFGSVLTDGDHRKKDAKYYYYHHGPLARVELGPLTGIVQGLDYAYTLQGWLKGVNGQVLNSGEIGSDGYGASTIGRDALAYSLGYYQGDYKSIGGSSANALESSYTTALGDITGKSLYNGNISHATYAIANINSGQIAGYTYGYDQLNRLVRKNFHNLSSNTGSWQANTGATNSYKELFNYDANGNITTLQRYGSSGLMDNLSYRYNRNSQQELQNNKLKHVADDVNGTTGSNDLASGQAADNYSYDEVGNLVGDAQAGILAIDWNVYGKIKSIDKAGTSEDLSYSYDAAGNRVSKTINGKTIYYIRDAQGNSLAVYEKDAVNDVTWKEQQLYGSSRLGMWKGDVNLATGNAPTTWGITGKKFFELNNHLGNVMSVVTDERIALEGGGYGADVVSASDYYAFGGQMPGRSFSLNSSSYRYGFNGKENDNEVKGEGNSIDFGERIYDSRLGRWLSVDPLAAKMPAWSPYSFGFNNPIYFIDPDGQEPTPAEAARMAAHVYGDKKNSVLTGGWQVSSRNFGIQLQTDAGLKSLVYERVVNGKVTEYTYATAGTENGKDWKENGKQPLGLSAQYEQAADNAKTLSKALNNTELNFVGHSLGGGEAALNSLVTSDEKLIGRKAFTFNAAGVGDITKFSEGTWTTPFKSEDKINAYILRTDPLNLLQNNSPIMPDVNGKRNYLFPKDLPSTYNGHSIDNIIKNFGVTDPDKYKK